jgi:hypothetical protein
MRGEDTVGRKSYIYAEIGPFLTLFCAIAEELRLRKSGPHCGCGPQNSAQFWDSWNPQGNPRILRSTFGIVLRSRNSSAIAQNNVKKGPISAYI